MNNREEILSGIKFFVGLSIVILLLLTFCVFGSFSSLCQHYLAEEKNKISINNIFDSDKNQEIEITINNTLPCKLEFGSEPDSNKVKVLSLNVNNYAIFCLIAKLICYLSIIIFIIILFKLTFNFYAKINHDALSFEKAKMISERISTPEKKEYEKTININIKKE